MTKKSNNKKRGKPLLKLYIYKFEAKDKGKDEIEFSFDKDTLPKVILDYIDKGKPEGRVQFKIGKCSVSY